MIIDRRYPCSAPCPSDDLTGWSFTPSRLTWLRRDKGTEIYSRAVRWQQTDCQRASLPISVNLYRCLVQTLFSVLTLATEDASTNNRVVCQGSLTFGTDNFPLFPIFREILCLTTEGHIDDRRSGSTAYQGNSEASAADKLIGSRAPGAAIGLSDLVTRFICFLSSFWDHDSNFHESQS